MYSRSQKRWFLAIVLSLLILALVATGAPELYAQDYEDVTGGSGFVLPDVPFVEKEEQLPEDNDDKPEQFNYSLYIPNATNGTPAVNAAATAATWQTVHFQTFEASFETGQGGWTITDYNGSTVGGIKVWDDTATKAYAGYWSAHPNDAATYGNLTDTIMKYGPFSLVGAKDAKMTFVYWLESETLYDEFSFEYACTNQYNWGVGETRSGMIKKWMPETFSLIKCIGKSQVWVRFRFTSDYSGTGAGVWVDNIRIEKYQ